MIEVNVELDEPGLAVVTCERLILTFVDRSVNEGFLDAAHRVGRALGRRYPGAVGSLTVTSPSIEIPPEPLRRLAATYTRDSNEWVRAGATVIAGDGFKASVARSVLTAMTIFARHPPRRVFDDSSRALDWLGDELASRVAIAPLESWLRRRLTAS